MQLRRKTGHPHLRRHKIGQDDKGTAKELDSSKYRKSGSGRVISSYLYVLFVACICFTVYLSINAVYVGPNLRADQRLLTDGNNGGNSHGIIKQPTDLKHELNPNPKPDAPKKPDVPEEPDAPKEPDVPKEPDASKETDAPNDVPKEAEPKRNRVVMGEVQTYNLSPNPAANATNSKVSLLILTYSKASALKNLLESIFVQDYPFELIVADNGCKEETIAALENAINQYRLTQPRRELVIKYYPLCENLGYAGGNNAAAKIANNSSDWILLLNDDIVMKEKDFVKNMMDLAPTKEDCAAVGCTLLNAEGTQLIESGSIAWQDGSAAGFGRDRKDLAAPEFTYARTVDYVSGACLMVNKNMFNDYGGFDGENFPNYYEDTDLQMHIQHDIQKEVWLQPRSVALHDEHGSFGAADATAKMEAASKLFVNKWKDSLQQNHLPNPYLLQEKEQSVVFLKASNRRARDESTPNILYIDNSVEDDLFIDNKLYENLSMIVELSMKVTFASSNMNFGEKCDVSCKNKYSDLGVELFISKDWKKVLLTRPGFYDVVIVSRPRTMDDVNKVLRDSHNRSKFAVVYDAGYLRCRRNALLQEMYRSNIRTNDITQEAPLQSRRSLERFCMDDDQIQEISNMKMADIVLTISDKEKEILQKLLPDNTKIRALGHVIECCEQVSVEDFDKRSGILYIVPSFSSVSGPSSKYNYNVDAISYFLRTVYPLILEGDSGAATSPIPLTIAGRDIPGSIIDMVKNNMTEIASHVTFVESPRDVKHMYATTRVLIAPHAFGGGDPYTVSNIEVDLRLFVYF